MAGLLALLGGKSSAPDDDMDAPAKGGGAEREYAREAFTALKDDDEEGFITALLGAVRACSKKSSAGEYESEDDEE
jgi:hypothetical protein